MSTQPLPELVFSEAGLSLTYVIGGSGTARTRIDFDGALAHYLGWPNDEVLYAHRLYPAGVRPFGAYEVKYSSWITALMSGNRRHLNHDDALFEPYRHFVLTFQDETFECVAKGFAVTLI